MAEEKKEEQSPQKCRIYYKVGWISSKLCFGDRFDDLDSCCEMFKKIFFQTGNNKNTSWNINTLFDEKPGLNLLRRGGEINLFFCGEPIRFCPWSGHEIEVQKSRDVLVNRKMKEVSDGYEEVPLKEGWDQ